MPGREMIARGRVQGVGFRWFVQEIALVYGIKGYVRNMSDGSVLIIAIGSEVSLTAFEQEVRQGHRHARVDNLEVTELSHYKEYEDFVIA